MNRTDTFQTLREQIATAIAIAAIDGPESDDGRGVVAGYLATLDRLEAEDASEIVEPLELTEFEWQQLKQANQEIAKLTAQKTAAEQRVKMLSTDLGDAREFSEKQTARIAELEESLTRAIADGASHLTLARKLEGVLREAFAMPSMHIAVVVRAAREHGAELAPETERKPSDVPEDLQPREWPEVELEPVVRNPSEAERQLDESSRAFIAAERRKFDAP